MSSNYPTSLDTYGSEQVVAVQTELGVNAGRKTEIITAAETVAAADNNTTYIADAVDLVITLPAVATVGANFRVKAIVKTVSATTGLSLSPNSADSIYGNGFTVADDKDAVNTAATDAVGDMISLVSDGVDGWFIDGIIGTWAREA